MTTRFVAPTVGVIALLITGPASAAPFANAWTPPSLLLSTVEHDRSDSDYGRRDTRSDNRRNDSDRDEDFQDHGEGWRGGKGASFWLRSGDLRLGARCAQGEAMRACVDAALLLLDKAKSAQTQAPTPSANTPTSPAR